jgi:hypothetical protein
MNYYRLAHALNSDVMRLYESLDQEYFAKRWFFRRCRFCGKAELKFDEFIHQSDGASVFAICRDHGGQDGREYVDCLTAVAITVPPSPPLLLKALKDPCQELFFWVKVWIRYAFSYIVDGFDICMHPVAYYRWKRKQ